MNPNPSDVALMLRSARRRIAAALALHPREVNSNRCLTCEAEWPCDTVRALGGAS